MSNQKDTIKAKKTTINQEVGSKLIDEIIKENDIDMKIYYVESFKVKKGSWDTSAKKREQLLKWTTESQQVTDENDKVTKTKHNQQIMRGSSIHYPEFMVNVNETNSIEVTFKRKPIEADILEDYKELIKDLPKLDVPKHFRKRVVKTGIAAEIATVDAHFAKLAREKETGYRNYDMKIAREDYEYVFEKGLDLISPYKPELIIDIIGNDLYHMDNMEGKTTHGQHSMDVDGRITKVHKTIFEIKRNSIIQARQIAPVRVIWIPGNHDFLSSYMLVFALAEHFKNDKKVTFDLGESPRKAILWGDLLVGWNHAIKGRYSTWINELPQQFPELWGKSKIREWHCGDQHKKVTTRLITPVNTIGGVTIRQMTALSPVDKWHTENIFTDAVPGGEVLLWDKVEGVFANFTLFTGQYENHRNKLINKSNKNGKKS